MGSVFQGNRVLYIHTGGRVDVFDELSQDDALNNSDGMQVWEDISKSPFNL